MPVYEVRLKVPVMFLLCAIEARDEAAARDQAAELFRSWAAGLRGSEFEAKERDYVVRV